MRAVTPFERWCAEWDALILDADSLGAAIDATIDRVRALHERAIDAAYGTLGGSKGANSAPLNRETCPACGRAVEPGVIH